MVKFNFWRFFAAIMIGFALGFASGAWFYRSYLDKPSAMVEIGKQKIRGTNNHGTFSNEASSEETEVKERRGLFNWFNTKKEDNER